MAEYLMFHPLSNVYPMVGGLGWQRMSNGRPVMLNADENEAWKEFVASIRTEGLLVPIVLWDGQIIDGRNRYIACLEAGVEPHFIKVEKIVDGWADLSDERKLERAERLTYDANKKRTQYDKGMIALITVPRLLKRLAEADLGALSRRDSPALAVTSRNSWAKEPYEDVAKEAGVSVDTLERALRILNHFGAGVVNDVVGGVRGFREADRAARAERKAEKELEARQIKDAAAKGDLVKQQLLVHIPLQDAIWHLGAAARHLSNAAGACSDYGWTHLDLSVRDRLALAVHKLEEALRSVPWGEEDDDG